MCQDFFFHFYLLHEQLRALAISLVQMAVIGMTKREADIQDGHSDENICSNVRIYVNLNVHI